MDEQKCKYCHKINILDKTDDCETKKIIIEVFFDSIDSDRVLTYITDEQAKKIERPSYKEIEEKIGYESDVIKWISYFDVILDHEQDYYDPNSTEIDVFEYVNSKSSNPPISNKKNF